MSLLARLGLTALCVCLSVTAAGAEDSAPSSSPSDETTQTASAETPQSSDFAKDLEQAQARRRGAGLRAGYWSVADLPQSSGVESSKSPAFEGYFQKGLDAHLTMESTVGFWRWNQTAEQQGTLGGSSREQVSLFVVPTFTAIKLYPFTTVEDRFEPYALGGVGFALAIEDRESTGSSLGLTSGNNTLFHMGFGFKAGAGMDWRFSRAFGLGAGVRYQWIRFGQEVQGVRTYKGMGVNTGLTYHFQAD